jgi:hypothetical protein
LKSEFCQNAPRKRALQQKHIACIAVSSVI